MKVKGVSFSKYKVSLNTYNLEKLDLFSFLFSKIILNEKLNGDLKLVDCLKDLDIKDELFYLFNNVYYKFIDNGIIESVKEDINDVYLKDIRISGLFKESLNKGLFPKFEGNIEKEFIYDYLEDKVVLEKDSYKESNVCVLEVNNQKIDIEQIINNNKKGLLNLSDGFCVLKDVLADPYYFQIELIEKDNKYFYNGKAKEDIYNALRNNSLYVNDKILKGDVLTNNIYFDCLYGNSNLKDYCRYLFVNDKEKMGIIDDNIIYVDYDLSKKDFVDLVNKEDYACGVYFLEDDTKVSTFVKEKSKVVSDFKLYLIKNKNKFKENISEIIELI